MRFLLFTFVICIELATAIAQPTKISGTALDYAKRKITFYSISDPILNQKQVLATTTIGNDGKFAFEITLKKTVEIRCDLEKHCGTMILEPGEKYTIQLPPYTPRSNEEAKSIYFKPTLFWFGILNKDPKDLNFSVRAFLSDYNTEFSKNSAQIYQLKSKATADQIISRLDQKYESIQNSYFKNVKKYSYFELENSVNQDNTDFLVSKYFQSKNLDIEHPTFQKAFETIFTDCLRKQSQNQKNSSIIPFINGGQFDKLVAFYKTKGYAQEVAELAILKGLYDGYYTGSFNKTGLLKGIDQARHSAIGSVAKSVAEQIYIKLTKLAIGAKAPTFKLPNIQNKPTSLEQFKGKFVYLAFFNSKSHDCQMELDSIISIHRKLNPALTVLAISLDENFDTSINLWKGKGYKWELLNGAKQEQVKLDYNATLTPAFFLISPDQTLLLAQAPSPSHGFEPVFLKILRDSHFKFIQPASQKTIPSTK
jgi:peroxiredoxin